MSFHPYFDPVNPNIHPILQRELSLIGAKIALDLTSQGYTGALSNAVYDTWWHGGFRTVPYRHNMVGILSEAARVKNRFANLSTSQRLEGAPTRSRKVCASDQLS